mmetsp:Transcript_103920/g.334912  ORF Transcript_103920/g.334912 Transcript_103920/m.334912 type:complete len:761 (-) Transcript_103920:93-2375(-)
MCSMPVQLAHLPHEVLAGVAWSLRVRDAGQLAACCQVLSQEAGDSELWFHLFMRSCWPPSSALLAFSEGGSLCPTSVDWRARLQVRTEVLPTIVVDLGRGYTKYTVVHGVDGRMEGDGRPPCIVQLCSSPTHPADCSHGDQLQYIHSQLDRSLMTAATDPTHALHRASLARGESPTPRTAAVVHGLQAKPELNGKLVVVEGFHEDKGRWSVRELQGQEKFLLKEENIVPVHRAQDLHIIIGEPFAISASRHLPGRVGGWDTNLAEQLGRSRRGLVQVVSQAQMALWAHGIDHGIVVNIGQGQTIAIPVINGETIPELAQSSDLGSRDLTMSMVRHLSRRYRNVGNQHMTWCRDLKESHCYVVPPAPGTRKALVDRLADGDDFGVRSVRVELPDEEDESIELAEERILVPEELFVNAPGQPSLPMLIVRCAEQALATSRCDEEGVRSLLKQVVLVGGAADFPGIRPRTEYEIRFLLREVCTDRLRSALASPDDAFVLNPPLGGAGPLATPRFVPLLGGCVRAVSSKDSKAGSSSSAVAPIEPAEPFRVTPALARVPGMATWLRQRMMMNLNGPAVFRTGGGGGEDDQVLHWLGEDEEEGGAAPESSSDEEAEMAESELDKEEDESEEPSSSPMFDDEPAPAPPRAPAAAVAAEAASEEALTGAAAAAHPEVQTPTRRNRKRGRGAAASSSAQAKATGSASGSGGGGGRKGGRGGKGRGGKGKSEGESTGQSDGQGKGNAKGKGKGKGKAGRPQMVWRPVLR